MDLYAAAPDVAIVVADNARKNLKTTAPTVTDFIALERQKLTRFAALLHDRDRKA